MPRVRGLGRAPRGWMAFDGVGWRMGQWRGLDSGGVVFERLKPPTWGVSIRGFQVENPPKTGENGRGWLFIEILETPYAYKVMEEWVTEYGLATKRAVKGDPDNP